MGFSWVKIADFLSVSERTLRNKRVELEISLKYSQITEMELDGQVQTILTENPDLVGKVRIHTKCFMVMAWFYIQCPNF